MKQTILVLISLLLLSLTGCMATIAPVASVIGASASVTNAYWEVTEQENITVIAPECLWYRTISLSDESKAGMTRADKEQLAYLNEMESKHCPK